MTTHTEILPSWRPGSTRQALFVPGRSRIGAHPREWPVSTTMEPSGVSPRLVGWTSSSKLVCDERGSLHRCEIVPSSPPSSRKTTRRSPRSVSNGSAGVGRVLEELTGGPARARDYMTRATHPTL